MEILEFTRSGNRSYEKAGIIPDEGFAGFDGIIVGREVIKREDHG